MQNSEQDRIDFETVIIPEPFRKTPIPAYASARHSARVTFIDSRGMAAWQLILYADPVDIDFTIPCAKTASS
jgi:hypothetical protein